MCHRAADTPRVESNDVARWLTNRAWSRAGAIAVVMSTGTPRRVVVLSTRVLLLLGGSLAIAVAVATMLWNSFGPGPLDMFVVGLRDATGIPLTLAYWAAFGLVLMLAWVLGRRPGPGTLMTPLILGPAVQTILLLFERVDRPDAFATQVVVQVIAVGIAGLGAGALIVSGLGAGTGELLAMAASDRTGRPEPHIRIGVESCWFAAGVVLGGPFGFGTVIVAMLIGPAVSVGHRVVDRVVVSSRRQVAAAIPQRACDDAVIADVADLARVG